MKRGLTYQIVTIVAAGILMVSCTSAAQAGYYITQGDSVEKVTVLTGTESVTAFYKYFPPQSRNELTKSDTSILFLYQDPQGTISLVMIHDRRNDGSGGKVVFTFSGVPTGTNFILRDDAAGTEATLPTSLWRWNNFHTDGGVLSGSLNQDFCLSIDPDFPTSGGLTAGKIDTWEFFTGDVSNSTSITLDMDTPITICCDSTHPVVACALATQLLWPPNHDLVDVGLDFEVVDNLDDAPSVEVLVFSDEDDEEPTGSGNHSPDATDDGTTLRLRAERKGNSDGRVYLIVIIAEDLAGNVGYDCCTVVVPKSQSRKHIADVDAQAAAAEAFCLLFGEEPPGFVLVGDGAVIGPKQ